ncbi:transposase [Nocardioides panzhihuensis]|uniref:Transposase n=1 Tax=Nocardioides panzhihuensis TaxID=860243 RepID=A0A7Z0DT64_9ACTN|nr:transposase [Nocardioides panzhihuensis]
MSHGSARLTVHGRRLIVQRHQASWPKAHIAAAMGVSRKCVTTWINRYAAEGEAGLATRSSRPHTMPTRTSHEVEQEVLAARAEHRGGPDVLGPKVGVAPRTVSRILRRHSVPYLRACDPITGEVIRSSKQTALRYERDRPGELVHMDVKKLGRIPDGGGWRAHGREMGRTRQRRANPIGYDYVHSLVDDHSRLAYSEVLRDEKGTTCAEFLDRAIAYFTAHGITRIERLMTDNAWAYRWSLRDLCATHEITQKFIKPHCP